MDLLSLYYSLKVIRGERTQHLISTAALIQNRPDGSKPCSMSDIEIFFFSQLFFFWRQGGKYFHRISSQESFPDDLADLIYFLASVIYQS